LPSQALKVLKQRVKEGWLDTKRRWQLENPTVLEQSEEHQSSIRENTATRLSSQ